MTFKRWYAVLMQTGDEWITERGDIPTLPEAYDQLAKQRRGLSHWASGLPVKRRIIRYGLREQIHVEVEGSPVED